MSEKTIGIITRMGDDGMTALADGRRVPKSSFRVEAIGNVDELNSLIGLLLSEELPPEMKAGLIAVQNDLFDIGAALAGSFQRRTGESQVSGLESQAEKYGASLVPQRHFILPGGVRAGAFLHYARSVCRRAERSVFALSETEKVEECVGKYLNRLSDLLFIYARAVNQEAGEVERLWEKNESGV